ncbi:hypothetical protein JKF63_01149 [Porcisia hertigi]|uniref:Transmembrane protein n=1 Tax=Porcisia hertigi TaxID=2761500 RepID=A0A836HXI9_9TRYP|nr:hypothetical protein JKF63_01149 [Porcisia hertigi]
MLRCNEPTFYAGLALLCSVAGSFAMVRAILYALGVAIHHLTEVKCLPSFLEHIVWVAGLFIAVVVLGDVSALTPWVVLLATATSGACCWSRRSFRWIGLSSYVLYSLAVMHVVGPLFLEEVELNGQEWSALMQGQRVLIPSAPPRPTDGRFALDESTPALYIYSYYRKVKIEGSTSPLAASTAPVASLRLPSELQLWWTRGPREVSRGTARVTKRPRHAFKPSVDHFLPTYHVMATGDDTQLLYYRREVDISAPPVVGGSDSILLLGHHGVIRHSNLYCIIPAQLIVPPPQSAAHVPSSSADVPCLRLRNTTRLHNVTIHWAFHPSFFSVPATSQADAHLVNSSNGTRYAWQSLQISSNSDQSCVDVESRLQRDFGIAVASSLIECVNEVNVKKLPLPFVAKAPLLVWLRWQFPEYVRRVQDWLVFLSSHVTTLASVLAVEVFHMSCRSATLLRQQCRVWVVKMAPYVKSGAEQTTLFARGAWCGSLATPGSSIGAGEGGGAVPQDLLNTMIMTPLSWCDEFASAYGTHPAFRAGAHTHASVAALVSVLVDALDLVPGVWSVYAWAWNTEYCITVWIVVTLRRVFSFLFYVAPPPIFHMLTLTAERTAALAPRVVTPLRCLWRKFSQLRVLTYFEGFCVFMWTLEKRLWCYEWITLKQVLTFFGRRCEKAVYLCAKCAAVSGVWVNTLVRHYNGTSFPTHMAVTLLQTTLLGIAMRNELNEVVVAEQRERAPVRNLVTRYMPTSLATWPPLSSFASRVSGFWTVARDHFVASLHYLLLHAVAALVLIGLSVLPLASKLYALSLHYVFPWLSCRYFLLFFSHDLPPARRVTVCFVGRMTVATVLQDTVGDFIYHVLKDTFIAVGLTGGLALLLWAWPQRATLAKQLATAISDSLQATPTSKSVGAREVADSSGVESRTKEKTAHDVEAQQQQQQQDMLVMKQVNFSDAN